MNRGKYIVLEGPEGVGKTTQIEILAKRLEAAGLPVRTFREPDSQTDLTARAIRSLTQDPRYPMNTRTEVLLYNAARAQSLEVVQKSLEQGVICLVDRNYLTTLAIQYYGRGDVPDYPTINTIIDFAVGHVQPDLCVVMDVPVPTLRERLKDRHQGDRFDNLDDAFLERVRAGYLWEAKQRELQVVFATDTREEVADTIWKHITKTLALREPSADQHTEPISVAQVIAQRELPAPHEPPFEPAIEPTIEVAPVDVPAAEIVITPATASYYTPDTLEPALQKQYKAAIDTILDLHKTMTATLAKHLVSHNSDQQADTILQAVLPVAAVSQEDQLRPTATNQPLAELAKANLANVRTDGSSQAVSLVDYWPKNELLLVPDMLYQTTDLSLEQLQTEVSSWSYDQKLDVFQTYLDQSVVPGSTLEKIHYSWDIVSSYDTFRELTGQHTADDLVRQELTPRYGYEVPDIIDEAGLTDQFEACFDVSLKLHSLLQREGHRHESQYATLLGHRLRWKATFNARDLLQLEASGTSIAIEMRQKLTDVHPLVGSAHQ